MTPPPHTCCHHRRHQLKNKRVEIVDERLVEGARLAAEAAAERLRLATASAAMAAAEAAAVRTPVDGATSAPYGSGGSTSGSGDGDVGGQTAAVAADGSGGAAGVDGGEAAAVLPDGGGGAGPDPAPAPEPEPPEVWLPRAMAPQRVRERFQADAAVLPELASPAWGAETAVVDGLVVSRGGHFTAPVQCGAVFIGHAPASFGSGGSGDGGDGSGGGGSGAATTATTVSGAAAAPAAAPPAGINSETAPQHAAPLWQQHADPLRRLAAQPFDPMVVALSAAVSVEDVLSAVADGALPPVAARCRLPGAEFIEFAPLAPQRLRARRAAGFPLAPVAWFRFAPRAELPPELVAAGQAALQALAPGDEAEEIVLPLDDDDDDEDGGDDGDGEGAESDDAEEGGMSLGDGSSGSGDADEAEDSGADGMDDALMASFDGAAGGSGGGGGGDNSSDDDALFADAEEGSGDGGDDGGAAGHAEASAPAGSGSDADGRGGSSAVAHGGGAGAPGAAPAAVAVAATAAAGDPACGFRVLPPPGLDEAEHVGPASLVLPIKLKHRRVGNMLLLKLINQVRVNAGGCGCVFVVPTWPCNHLSLLQHTYNSCPAGEPNARVPRQPRRAQHRRAVRRHPRLGRQIARGRATAVEACCVALFV